jgi:hypothetical protein
MKYPLNINVSVSYPDGHYIKSLAMDMKTRELLIGGKTFKDGYGDRFCYLPIFRNNNPDTT